MTEQGKDNRDALKKLKRISLPLGPKTLTFFQMRDGVGVKTSNLEKDNRKHASILFSENGTLGIHSTDEKYPHGHPKRNEHVCKMALPLTERLIAKFGSKLDALIQRETKAMLNPDLHDCKLLSFPVQPSDLADVVTIRGRKGEIDVNKCGQIQVLDPRDLPKYASRTFFVLKKARTWWHNEGILFKSPKAEVLFFMSNKLMGEIIHLVAPQCGSEVRPIVKFGELKYHDYEIRALEKVGKKASKAMKKLAFEAQNKILLNSAATNMFIWGTGLKEQIIKGVS